MITGTHVVHYEDDSPRPVGVVIENYAGEKRAMKGSVLVQWPCGGKTWETARDLTPVPAGYSEVTIRTGGLK